MANNIEEKNSTGAPPKGQLFDQDISATDLAAFAQTANPPLGPVIRALIHEWVGAYPERMDHPRIGTVYGYRDEDGVFSLRFVFRHSQSVEGVVGRSV